MTAPTNSELTLLLKKRRPNNHNPANPERFRLFRKELPTLLRAGNDRTPPSTKHSVKQAGSSLASRPEGKGKCRNAVVKKGAHVNPNSRCSATPRMKDLGCTHSSFLLKDTGKDMQSRKPLHRHTTSAIAGSTKRNARKPVPCASRERTGKKSLAECRVTEEERLKYGNRCPLGYAKVCLLGKGGCALVWSAKDMNGNSVAIKQFAKSNKSKADIESAYVEMRIGELLFGSTSSKVDRNEYPGIGGIATYVAKIDEAKDMWLIYEEGGSSLTKSLFEIKGEFYKGERVYRVSSQPFYDQIKENPKLLKLLLRKLIEVLDLLQHRRIVHCDLKPENLLVSYDGKKLKLKVIDFGSAFMYGEEGSFRMATPEYMPPECLELLRQNAGGLLDLSRKTQPWSVDVWSAGSVLLEVLTGFPLWLSLKGRVQGATRTVLGLGAFAVKGKELGKIIQKQTETVHKLRETLKRYDTFTDDEQLVALLERMLDLNPMTRISPRDALKHPALII